VAKKKHLSLTDVEKQHVKEFNELKRVHLKNGSYCDVYVKFRPTKIQKLIEEYQDILVQLGKRDELMGDNIKGLSFIFYMLLLRHFTTLGDQIPLDIEKMIVACEKLIDLGILEELLNAFPQEEINKIDEMIRKIDANTRLIGDQIGELILQNNL